MGIEAQKEGGSAVLSRATSVVGSFTETESGKINARPQLVAALRLCRQRKAVLCIAKLIAEPQRRVLTALLEGDVQVIACDNPAATNSRSISSQAVAGTRRRCLAAYQGCAAAAKARGVVLGGWKGVAMRADGARQRDAVQASMAGKPASSLAPVIAELKAEGVASLPAMADALEQPTDPTSRGGRWHAASVARVVARIS